MTDKPPMLEKKAEIDFSETKNWLRTARTITEALPYMRRYAGKTFVIKYGGHAMGDEKVADTFARDIVLLKQVGVNPIVVHGGGPQIGQMLERLKIKSEFVQGLRVTDAATVEIVEMVLSGSINKELVSAINKAGGTAIGLSGKDGNLVQATKLRRTQKDPNSNIEKILDLGFECRVALAQTGILLALIDHRLFEPAVLHDATLTPPQTDLQGEQQDDQDDEDGTHASPGRIDRLMPPIRPGCSQPDWRRWGKAPRPAYVAALPRRSSIRSNWLYLATRSVRHNEPVLICVAADATDRSAIVVSSVSPERCDTTEA